MGFLMTLFCAPLIRICVCFFFFFDGVLAGLLGSQTRQFDKLIEQCNVELTSVFGMELVELRARGYNPGEVVLQNELKRQSQKNSQAPRDGEDEDLPTKSNKGKGAISPPYHTFNPFDQKKKKSHVRAV
jgi:hypothetical protein